MGRVWVCMLSASEREERGDGEGVGLCATFLKSRGLGGVGLRKKPKDLSASESEECGHWEGRDVYANLTSSLLRSDTVQAYGRAKGGTRPAGVELRKNK